MKPTAKVIFHAMQYDYYYIASSNCWVKNEFTDIKKTVSFLSVLSKLCKHFKKLSDVRLKHVMSDINRLLPDIEPDTSKFEIGDIVIVNIKGVWSVDVVISLSRGHPLLKSYSEYTSIIKTNKKRDII